MKGERGLYGSSGIRGHAGAKGARGLKGEIGEAGKDGMNCVLSDGATDEDNEQGSMTCEEASQGSPGQKGDRGEPGSPGLEGPQGRVGFPGRPGVSGYAGAPGRPGLPGAPGKPVGAYLLVLHGKSATDYCPFGYSRLWSGYSLFEINIGQKTYKQSLEEPGSCLFDPQHIPRSSCIGGTCDQELISTKWLANAEEMPTNELSIQATKRLLSRCIVCESASPAVTVHSLSMQVPECPSEWTSLWTGYTLTGQTHADSNMPHQSSSTTSCAKTLNSTNVIECGSGKCKVSSTSLNNQWIYASNQHQDIEDSLEATEAMARCSVCVKNGD